MSIPGRKQSVGVVLVVVVPGLIIVVPVPSVGGGVLESPWLHQAAYM